MTPIARTSRAALIAALACSAGAGAAAESVEALRQRLEARETRIRELEQRYEALEARMSALEADGGAAAGSPAPAPAPAPAAGVADGGTARASPDAPPARGPREGGLEVDAAAAERALERTLTQEGSLLLDAGRADVSPFVSYQYTDDASGRQIIFADADGDGNAESPVTETIRSRRDELRAGVEVRLGLPYDSQIEARIPLIAARQREDMALLGSGGDETAVGFGDVELGVAKTLVRESGFLPDVIGRVSYSPPTGTEAQNGVPLAEDTHSVGGSVTLLKRQDPLAFSARLRYERSFEDDGVRRGGLFGVSAGAFLAASPETSLSLGVNASFRGETEIAGVSVAGSEERQAIATFGISSVVFSNVLLNFNVGVGLTEDSPDFTLGLSVPIRFDAF